MKIGVIYTAFNTEEYIEGSLRPWLEANESKLGGHEYIIGAISPRFKSFVREPRDKTAIMMTAMLERASQEPPKISDEPISEIDARTYALLSLIAKGAEIVIQVDSDEFYQLPEIERIFSFVFVRPHIVWFRGTLRNYVFDEHTYIVDPFTPPRVHRVKLNNGFIANTFWDDNNILYSFDQQVVRDIDFPSIVIPKSVAWIRHRSWINNERSRKKQDYQRARWGHCAFRWDETRGLCFDESYYASKGLPLPEVLRD